MVRSFVAVGLLALAACSVRDRDCRDVCADTALACINGCYPKDACANDAPACRAEQERCGRECLARQTSCTTVCKPGEGTAVR